MEYITFIYALLLSLAQTFMGFGVSRALANKLDCTYEVSASQEARLLPVYWILGLLVHLSLILVLKSIGLPWQVAVFLPLLLILGLLCVFARKDLSLLSDTLGVAASSALNVPFMVWLVLQVYIGASLFTLERGLSTPWMNNYGDLAFHLGMIQSFVVQGDFPASYHIYAGEPLSYPFFINLWTAVLWSPFERYETLHAVFLFQWLALWGVVYSLLVKGRAVYLPWVLLLGGGSYVAIIRHPEPFSWQLISKGFPWTTWLSTIWVTQRSALLGVAAALAASCLVVNTFNFERGLHWRMAVAGCILALMPLAHTHYFLFTALFLGVYLGLWGCLRVEKTRLSVASFYASLHSSGLITLVLFSLPALLFFPFLLSKSGMASMMLGWTVPYMKPGFDSLIASFTMWVNNAPQWCVAVCVLCFITRKYLAFTVLVGMFILANVVKLATWEWDQLKVFLVIFTLMLVIWRLYLEQVPQGLIKSVVCYTLACLLVFPGVYEVVRIVRTSPSFQVYSEQKIELAELISQHVPRHAVVASPDDHNSAATLSGRTLFFGFPGTLASHNIRYQQREHIQKNLENIVGCSERLKNDAQHCPTYIIWDLAASRYWGAPNPGPGYGKIASTKDKQQHIYRRLH